tara:strand:- start:578 stop:766 length:189 start_codon:yes stop_codon:yes gene_type:complete
VLSQTSQPGIQVSFITWSQDKNPVHMKVQQAHFMDVVQGGMENGKNFIGPKLMPDKTYEEVK